jgi:hypothetical protein
MKQPENSFPERARVCDVSEAGTAERRGLFGKKRLETVQVLDASKLLASKAVRLRNLYPARWCRARQSSRSRPQTLTNKVAKVIHALYWRFSLRAERFLETFCARKRIRFLSACFILASSGLSFLIRRTPAGDISQLLFEPFVSALGGTGGWSPSYIR